MATKKTIEFAAKNVKTFTNWLKRFSTIDNSLLLEINQDDSAFIAKTYNEERSVVKMSTIKFDDAGLTQQHSKKEKDTNRVKVGIFNIPRLIKIIDQFDDAEFTFKIEYQELIGDNETQFAGEKLLLKNNYLKMNVDCTSLNIFKYISDELFTDTIAKVDKLGNFELTKETLEQINTLNTLDNENRFMNFEFKNNDIIVSGKTYELRIGETNKNENNLSIFKDQYSTLDIENYNVELGEDRLIFKSKDSETTTVISKAEDDKD